VNAYILSINYDSILETVIFNYSVLNTENLTVPCISKVHSVYDVDVYIEPVTNSSRLLYTFYKN
jgi:hypothetical protein